MTHNQEGVQPLLAAGADRSDLGWQRGWLYRGFSRGRSRGKKKPPREYNFATAGIPAIMFPRLKKTLLRNRGRQYSPRVLNKIHRGTAGSDTNA